jgi:hypothetical protein
MTGFHSKQDIAADKLQEPINLLEVRKIAAEYRTPDSQIDSGNLYFALSKCLEHIDAQPAQEPSATRPCRSCGGTGERWTGIDEAPTSICKPCDGTGQIALAQPAQEPVAYVTGMSFGRFIVEPLNPAMVLPIGMALYSAPQGKT